MNPGLKFQQHISPVLQAKTPGLGGGQRTSGLHETLTQKKKRGGRRKEGGMEKEEGRLGRKKKKSHVEFPIPSSFNVAILGHKTLRRKSKNVFFRGDANAPRCPEYDKAGPDMGPLALLQ